MKKSIILILAVFIIFSLAQYAGAVESSSPVSSVGCQLQETSLGDLAADAVRTAGSTTLALIPAGAFKEISLPEGNIKNSDILKCLQYPEDKITVIELTGAQLLNALERSVSIYPQKNLGFLQVSGMEFQFDPGSTKGSKILSVKVDGKDLDKEGKYKVATTESFASGAYGYFTIWGKNLNKKSIDKTTSGALETFLQNHKTIDYGELNRIKRK